MVTEAVVENENKFHTLLPHPHPEISTAFTYGGRTSLSKKSSDSRKDMDKHLKRSTQNSD